MSRERGCLGWEKSVILELSKKQLDVLSSSGLLTHPCRRTAYLPSKFPHFLGPTFGYGTGGIHIEEDGSGRSAETCLVRGGISGSIMGLGRHNGNVEIAEWDSMIFCE